MTKLIDTAIFTHILSVGVSGPLVDFLNNPQAPENANPETLGTALFNDDGPDAWTALYNINTFSIYYMTSAFLGLLDKGSRDIEGYTSSVINITSISGILKIAQRHVGTSIIESRGQPTLTLKD